MQFSHFRNLEVISTLWGVTKRSAALKAALKHTAAHTLHTLRLWCMLFNFFSVFDITRHSNKQKPTCGACRKA